MSPLERDTPHMSSSFPRVSGDEPGQAGDRAVVAVFSPRERG